ncbi:transposase [Salinibacter ruber]|nr:transposase [Salinibacter ruber]
MPNTENGFAELLSWIDQEASRENVHVCLEASGRYHRSVARYLHEQNVTIAVVNPRRTSAYAKSQLARSKTDQVDAALLARFCQREGPSQWQPTSSARQDLKEMTRGLQGLKQERDRLQNRLDEVSNQTVIRSLQAVLKSINEQIDEFEEAIEEHVQSCRSLAEKQELLQTIPGVGAQTASQATLILSRPPSPRFRAHLAQLPLPFKYSSIKPGGRKKAIHYHWRWRTRPSRGKHSTPVGKRH